MALQHSPKIGILLALLGGLVISIDIPVIRLAGADPWIFLVARGFGMAIVLGSILLFAKKWTDTPPNPLSDPDFVKVGILYGLSSIFFTLSVFYTSTANLVFILAFNPLIAALLAWYIIGEKPRISTWIAIAVTCIGIIIIVSEGIEAGTGWGDLMALATAFVLGLSVVMARKSGKDMSLAGSLGGLVAGTFALPMAIVTFTIPAVPAWLIFNGLVMAPLAAFALALAPRYIPAPQVAMFFLLETVLAPVWVWLVFSEIPTQQTLLGGFIVLGAITFHSVVQLRRA